MKPIPTKYNVTQFLVDGKSEMVAQGVSSSEAVKSASLHSDSPGAQTGSVVRVIITDAGNNVYYDWQFGKGVVLPAIQLPNIGAAPVLDALAKRIADQLIPILSEPVKEGEQPKQITITDVRNALNADADTPSNENELRYVEDKIRAHIAEHLQ